MKLSNYLKAAALATATCLASTSALADGPAVVSFDYGALDTLIALGQQQHVLAVPKSGLPAYLEEATAALPDAGTLKVPDMAALKSLQPELVLVTGRQGEAVEELETFTKTNDVSLSDGAYRDSLEDKVMDLAALYGVEEAAHEQLDALWQHARQQRSRLPADARVVVLTHNAGRFSLRNAAVVSDVLGLQRPAIPDNVEAVKRGSRVFYPMTAETLVEMAPDLVLVVDRSAAIGKEPMPEGALSNALAEAGGEDIPVVLLDPALWYLSGAGLQSTQLQIDEVTAAVTANAGL
ncbi:ABC transporter substrate-binding protein [Granulosicoccaceae sp. 1_MG-2023]|nr:ABC transporter substrate-binding protein [Granulosicoccaceae sp. 1_MG-2023]